MTTPPKTTAPAAKTATQADGTPLIDMSDFDPAAAQAAHRLQIAEAYGEDILQEIDGAGDDDLDGVKPAS